MGIRFDCISCGKKLIVHDRFHGRQIRCPACEIQLKVPDKSILTDRSDAESAQGLGALPSHESTGKSERIFNDTGSRLPLPSESTVQEHVSSESIHRPQSSTQPDPLQHGDDLDSESSEIEIQDAPRTPKRRERAHEEEEDVEWDITPMVDVAFLLLIFFMLTASFSIQKAIPTSAEQQDKPSKNSIQRERADRPESFVIQIDEFNAYTVISNDGGTMEATSKQELIVVLKDLKAQLGDVSPRVDIQAHVLSIHGAVVACMDAAREAEFESFQMQSVEEFE